MSNNNNVTLKDALERMVKDLKLKPGMDETRIKDAWVRIMGNTIARYTTSVSLRNGKLYIQVNSAPLKNELQFSRAKIIEVINTELGDSVVNDVVVY